MVITYHGGHFVKISHGDTVIAANPFGKQAKYKPLRFGARIGLVSMNHPEMNGTDNLSYGEKVPFVISGPGEYEIGGISISGFLSPARAEHAGGPKPTGKEGLLNTIYTIELENMRLCFLGALSSPELSPELFEGIGEVDILFVPIAGGDVLTPSDAGKLSVSLPSKFVISLAF